MGIVVGFDTETHLIDDGLLAPPLVCLQWAISGTPTMCHREHARPVVEEWLQNSDLLVGFNTSYDTAVLAAEFPDLLPAIFAKYDRDEITDCRAREQLIMIARGTFRSQMRPDGEIEAVNYTLADCVRRHFGRTLKKEGWRLFYRAFDKAIDISIWDDVAARFQARVRAGDYPAWLRDYLDRGVLKTKDVEDMLAAPPSEAVAYAVEDGRSTLELYASQEKHFGHLLKDQFRQSRADFALHLCSAWGVYTDPDAVESLEKYLVEERDALVVELQGAGIIRADGSANTKMAKAAMEAACAEEGLPMARTKGGDVSLSAEACDRFDEHTLIGKYSRFLTVRKTLSNDIKMLRAGCERPLQARYDMADTGRTRASKPNVQAINRGVGIRECIVPREGHWFIQADFEGLELHTLAAWCLEKIGWSKLADKLNAGVDVHTEMAAEMLGISYEEAMRLKKSGDKELKEYRQRAKASNFGRPGGLGDKKFVAYGKSNYGVTITLEEAKQSKQAWLQRQPEMLEFFQLAAQATANPDQLGEEEHVFTGRTRGKMRYSALCNGRFQGLGADAAKEALWRVTKACYIDKTSPLYGCRPVLFIHDEIICECPAGPRAAAAAKELGRLMCEGANVYLSKVPVRTEPLIMGACWSKSAEPVYAEDGSLLPWFPKAA